MNRAIVYPSDRGEHIDQGNSQGGGAIEGSSVDGKDREFIESAMEMLVRFSVEISPKLAE